MPELPNVFGRLHRWATRQDENFLTKSLAVLLEHLLILAPGVGTRLISRLTGGFIEVAPVDASTIGIRSQVEAERGRLDLEIRVPHRLVWIEVKAESELRVGQLEGYRVLLGESGYKQTRLVLLTRYPETFAAGAGDPVVQIRWFQVADWLECELAALKETGEIAAFLSGQFLEFLRTRGMTLTQVGKYMPEGLRALSNLLNMLFEAAMACKVPVKKSHTWDTMGITLDGLKYWAGVRFTDPEKLWFGTYSGCRIDPAAAAQHGLSEELVKENWAPDGCTGSIWMPKMSIFSPDRRSAKWNG